MNHQKQKMVIAGIIVIVAVIAFYAGNMYGKKSAVASNYGGTQVGGMNRGGANGGAAGGRMGRSFASGTGLLSGEIISKDETSVTVKLRDGGSRIGFVGSSTAVMKSVAGSYADVVAGDQVMVIGKSNPDGSVNAQSIQIRPKVDGVTR